jgi:GT2 family glycosyltransferase
MFLPFTLIITTSNRERLLLDCVGSILTQNAYLDELIIIDNNSADSTRQRLAALQKSTLWQTRVVREKKPGYPTIYNRGLREAKTNWVAFLDDDCIAEPGWTEAVMLAIKKYPHAAALVGQTGTVTTRSWWSLAQLVNDGIWKGLGREGSTIIDFETLDNKNIVYNKQFLRQHAIQFDERLTPFFDGSSEDCDMGRQLEQAGGAAYYVPQMKALHHDPSTMIGFFCKLFRTSRAHVPFLLKWEKFDRSKQGRRFKNRGQKLTVIAHIAKKYRQLYNIYPIKFWLLWLMNNCIQKLLINPLQTYYKNQLRTQVNKALQ